MSKYDHELWRAWSADELSPRHRRARRECACNEPQVSDDDPDRCTCGGLLPDFEAQAAAEGDSRFHLEHEGG